jgi:membrane protease YdiL (CAAX protease family)
VATELEKSTLESRFRRIAPLWHTLGLLLLLVGFSLCFFRVQSASPAIHAIGGETRGNVTLYLAIIAAEWGLVCYVWLGGRCKGAVPLRELIGGRWKSLNAVLVDVAVAAAFWVVWTLAAIGLNYVVGPSHKESPRFLNPQGAVEIVLWVLMSVTAGFCEEVIYRGYLQKQMLSLTGSAAQAVFVQAVLFGAGHWYQGGKHVLIIMVLGALFGIFAYWRKSLRPGMISHAWTDILNVIPIRFP